MQTTLKFYINSQLVPPPDNWGALEGDLSFESGSPTAVLNNTKLTWKGSNAKIVNAAKASGLSGGLGIFEGPPLLITVCSGSVTDTFFNGCIDMTDPETLWMCDIVTTKIRNVNVETIDELFSSISFAYLSTYAVDGGPTTGPYNGAWINPWNESNINPNTGKYGDYLEILYQNNNIPDFLEFFTMVLSIYNIAQEAIKIANDIVGIASGIPAAALAVGLGGVILGVLELIGAIGGMILVCIALVDMVEMAIDYLISPIQTKLGMNVVTMITRACSYFGIQFNSSIFGVTNNKLTNPTYYSNMAIMPSKHAWPENNFNGKTVKFPLLSTYNVNQRMMYDEVYNLNHGGLAYGYYDGTISQLLNALADMFNAKAKVIINNAGQPELYFERWDYFYNTTTYKLPNINEQAPFGGQNPYSTNASEVVANYEVIWQTDSSDYNTLNDYKGTSCYYTVQPKTVSNQTNVTLKGLKSVQLQFAQATQKTQLTSVESIINLVWNDLVSIPNAIVSVINGITSFINKVTALVGIPGIPQIPPIPYNPFGQNTVTNCGGVLLLYNNITSTPKAMILNCKETIPNPLYSLSGPGTATGYLIDKNNKGQVTANVPCLSSQSLMKYFHYASLLQTFYPPAYPFAGPGASSKAGQPYYNQWQVYKDNNIPLCCSDYNLIYQNNIIQDYNGNYGRVMSLKWNIFKGMAKIDYMINTPYDLNLYSSFMIDGVTTQATL